MLKNLIIIAGALCSIPGAALVAFTIHAESGDVGQTLAGTAGMILAGVLMIVQAGEMK